MMQGMRMVLKKSWLIYVQLLYSEKLNNQLVMEKN